MTPTHEMLCFVQEAMLVFRDRRVSRLPRLRRWYRRMERIEAYLIARMGR